MWKLFILIGLLCLFQDYVSTDNGVEKSGKRELAYLQILTTNGFYAPLSLYPNDENTEDDWPEGIGLLPKLGKLQQYEMGKFLRKFYNHFITSDPGEIDAFSSFEDRSTISLISFLASLYAPTEEWQFMPGFKWQPIVLCYMEKWDIFFSYKDRCMTQIEERVKIMSSRTMREHVLKDEFLYTYWSENSGMAIEDQLDVALLYDTIDKEQRAGLKVPRWARMYLTDMKRISDFAYSWLYNSTASLQLKVGPLIDLITVRMRVKTMEENPDPNILVSVYLTVFRNGISAPRELYPNDPNHPDQWEEGMGELTIQGRRQLYALGKELRKRYSHFITANPKEITVQAATDPKNMRSGLSMLASLYAPTDFWEFMPGLPWQPVPVFYLPEDEDKVLSSFQNCPLVLDRMKKLVGQFGNDTVLEMYEQQMKFWSLNSGWPIRDWNDVVKLHRILSVEYSNKHNVPSWAWKYWKELVCLNDHAYKINFNDNKILKVVGGPILYNLVDNAVEKVKGDFSPLIQTKVMGFSGKSSHVAGLLGALKVFNDKEPPFASLVVMELFRDDQNDTFVRWLFNNGTGFQLLRLPECQEFCTLEYMHQQALRYESTKWGVDCRGPPAALDQLKELIKGIGM